MPGTTVSPDGRAASASAQPAVVSWSVSATTSRPAARAVPSSSDGLSVPPDTEEWVCRSISITAEPAARSRLARRQAPDGLGVAVTGLHGGRSGRRRRLGVALVVAAGGRRPTPVAAEQQCADPAIEVVCAGQERDLRQRLLLACGL